jgi:hypothetical protein
MCNRYIKSRRSAARTATAPDGDDVKAKPVDDGGEWHRDVCRVGFL